MKQRTDEEIVKIIKGYEESGQSLRMYCRGRGISVATYYNWKKQFGSMDIGEVRQLRILERENARLKKLLAERDLEVDAMREVLRKKW